MNRYAMSGTYVRYYCGIGLNLIRIVRIPLWKGVKTSEVRFSNLIPTSPEPHLNLIVHAKKF